MAFWRAGRRVQIAQVGKRLLGIGAFILLTTLLAPFSNQATVIWLLIGVFIAGVGMLLKPTDEHKTISSLTLLSGVFLLAILSLWVIPYGHHSYISTRTPKILAEPGTVALTTKLPWTIMLLVVVAAYFAVRLSRHRLPINPTRVTLLVLWLLAPLVLIYLVLRDPSFDMGHVVGTDLPIFAAYAVGGAAHGEPLHAIWAATLPCKASGAEKAGRSRASERWRAASRRAWLVTSECLMSKYGEIINYI